MLEQAGVIINTTDGSGKQIKVVAGTESEKLEAQADKLLSQNSNKQQHNNSEEDEAEFEDDIDEDMDNDSNRRDSSNQKAESGFFKF